MPKKNKQVGVLLDDETEKILEEMKEHFRKEYIEISDGEAIRIALRAWKAHGKS